ncbi:hypothetical protein thsrh120_54720 [Rhizobium sp. No.120]
MSRSFLRYDANLDCLVRIIGGRESPPVGQFHLHEKLCQSANDLGECSNFRFIFGGWLELAALREVA